MSLVTLVSLVLAFAAFALIFRSIALRQRVCFEYASRIWFAAAAGLALLVGVAARFLA